MYRLIKALSEEVRDAVKGYRLHGDRDPPDGVTIYRQFIPIERFEREDGRYHPFILTALRTVEDGEQTEMEAGLTFGVYGEDDETWVDLLNLMETVRLRLLSKRVIGRRYRLIDTLTSEINELQPAPFFYGAMMLRYATEQIREEVGMRNGNI